MPMAVAPDAEARTTSGHGTIERTADGPALVDALADDEACRTLLGAMFGEHSIAMRDGTVRARAQEPATDARRWPIVRGAAEQSNSCVMFGHRYILKLLRRIEPGPNPEIEISRFLASRGFAGVPQLAASLEYERPGDEPAALALVQTFVARTRVHGDYHLGQVLSVGRDFVIIDFEGEPARPLVERRAKHSPLKDVAGMLRSFSYAAQAALVGASDNPDPTGKLEPRARLWEEGVGAVFLKEYRRTAAGGALVPADDRSFEQLLRAFILDKALYEVGYELASRPQWVGLALLGILRILKAPDGGTGVR